MAKSQMKKALALSLATLAMAAHAHAGSDPRDKTNDPRAVEKEVKDSAKTVGTGSNDPVVITQQLNKTNLPRLSPDRQHALNEQIAADPLTRTLVNEIISQAGNSNLQTLNSAQLEGLSNLKGIDRSQTTQTLSALDPAVRAEQSYFTLVTSVARAARSWKGQSLNVATDLLVKANAHIAAGKSRGEALLEAKQEVEQDVNRQKVAGAADFKINLDDIYKFCKTI